MNKEKSTNLIYNKLLEQLLYPMLLYLPSNLANDFRNDENLKPLFNLADVLLAVENKEYNFLVNQESSLIFMYNKTKLLEGNLFDLIDAKETLTVVQFEFLLENYKQHLDAWIYILNVLQKEIVSATNKMLLKNKQYFKYQATVLLQHKCSIEERFVKSIKTGIQLRLKDVFKEELQQVATSSLISATKKATKKQLVLITSIEADNYLLEKVFGINF